MIDNKEYAKYMREKCVKDHNGNITCSPELWEELARIIENSEEVKHGVWLDDIQKFTSPAGVTKDYLVGYKCSLCGRTARIKEPYCNCGAKMDGGKAE